MSDDQEGGVGRRRAQREREQEEQRARDAYGRNLSSLYALDSRYRDDMFPGISDQDLKFRMDGATEDDVGHYYTPDGQKTWMYNPTIAQYGQWNEGLRHLTFDPKTIQGSNPGSLSTVEDILNGRQYVDPSQADDYGRVVGEYNKWKSQQSHGWADKWLPVLGGAAMFGLPLAAAMSAGVGVGATGAGSAGAGAAGSLADVFPASATDMAGAVASGGAVDMGTIGAGTAAGGGAAGGAAGWLSDPAVLQATQASSAAFDPLAAGGIPNAAGDALALTQPVASGGAVATGGATAGAWWEPLFDAGKGVFNSVFNTPPVSAGKSLIDGAGAIANYFLNKDQQDAYMKAAERGDPFGAQRPFYQAELMQAFTNPNYFSQNTVFKGINDEIQRSTIAEMAKRGLGRSGELGKELNLRQTNAAYPFANNFLQTVGNFAGAQIQPGNSAQLQYNAATADMNNWQNVLGGIGQVAKSTGIADKIGEGIKSILS